MKYQHQFVPSDGDDSVLRMFSVGDLLTVGRMQNAHIDMQDATSITERIEGLIPALADFHTFENFLEVSVIY